MNWVPVVFVIFKVTVLGIGMYYAVKWHYDRAREKDPAATDRGLVRSAAIVVGGFALVVGILLALTLGVASLLGLDLSSP